MTKTSLNNGLVQSPFFFWAALVSSRGQKKNIEEFHRYIYIYTLPQCNCEYTDGRLYTCIPPFFFKRFPEPNPLGEIDPCAKRPHIPWTNCQCQAEPDVLTRYSAQSLTSSPVVGVQLGIGWSEVPPGDDARRNLPNWKSNGRVPPIFLEAWFRGSEFHHFFLKKGVKIIFQKRSTI